MKSGIGNHTIPPFLTSSFFVLQAIMHPHAYSRYCFTLTVDRRFTYFTPSLTVKSPVTSANFDTSDTKLLRSGDMKQSQMD